MKSVCGRTVDIRLQSGEGQILALTAYFVQAVKDLGSVQRSTGQSLGKQLHFSSGQTAGSCLKSLTVCCHNLPFFKGFDLIVLGPL